MIALGSHEGEHFISAFQGGGGGGGGGGRGLREQGGRGLKKHHRTNVHTRTTNKRHTYQSGYLTEKRLENRNVLRLRVKESGDAVWRTVVGEDYSLLLFINI